MIFSQAIYELGISSATPAVTLYLITSEQSWVMKLLQQDKIDKNTIVLWTCHSFALHHAVPVRIWQHGA